MYRKALITALMLGISMVGFSKTEEIKNVNPKELAKTVVENSHNELLGKMQSQLQANQGRKAKINKMTKAEQFLYQENLIDSVLKADSHNLSDVFAELVHESNMPTEMIYEGINIDINKIKYKVFETGRKRGQIDSCTLIVPVSFQAHTIAKAGVSDVRYNVTFTWEVKVKEVSERIGKKTVVVKYKPQGTPTLVSSAATPISFLRSEQNKMMNAARKAITEWYANLPETLDKQYAEQSVTAIEAMIVSPDKIGINMPYSQNFTVTDVPTITVDIDPYQFIKEEDRPLYTNPEAQMVITPVFNISVDDSFENAEISVSYTVKVNEPITDSVKVERSIAAGAFIAELTDQLSSYVTSRDAEQKAVIENMFETTESIVEVSHLPKRGPEKIKEESAKKYLSLLKGTALNISTDNIEVVTSNWDSLIYTVNQEYRSKTYSDYTQKRVYLIYDSTKDAYLINKIEVVPNSTRIE